jgi:hypothetical protein
MASATSDAESPEALAEKLVSAMKSGSEEALLPLFHPDCPRNDSRFSLFERVVKRDLKAPEIEIKPVPQGALDNSEWLVQPSHMIGIHGYEDPGSFKGFYSRGDAVAMKAGHWYLVTCRVPKAETLTPR